MQRQQDPTELPAMTEEASERASSRLGLPLLPRLAALLEIAVLIVPLTLINISYPSVLQLAELQPHPFWLPVLLLSLQYGTVSGLIAAAVAILATVLIGWPAQDIGENHFAYLLRIWWQPALWIATALLLGQFRLRQIEAKVDLRRSVSELTSQRNAIADYARNLRQRCDALERHIATRPDARAPDALEALVGLSSAPRNQLSAVLGDALEVLFGTCKGSVFANDGDGLRLVASAEWGAQERFRTRIGPLSPLYRAIAVEGRQLSVLIPGDERDLEGEGVLAVPILAATGDRVIGMAKVEVLSPEALVAESADRLRLLAVLLTPVIESHASVRLLPISAAGAGQPAAGSRKVSPAARARIWRRLRGRGAAGTATATMTTGDVRTAVSPAASPSTTPSVPGR